MHGDEFALFLSRLDQPGDAERRAREITALLAEPLLVEGLQLVAAGSVGAAADTAATADLSMLLRHADQRMYHAKRNHQLTALPTTPRLRLRDHDGKDAA